MKRILSLILVLVLVLGSMPLAFAYEHEMTDGEKLKELGLVQGDEEGNLMEDSALTRAEMMVMLARLNGVEDEVQNYDLPSTFTDVEDHWAAKYVAYAEVQGWTQGVGDNLFAPQSEVNAQQVATFLLRVLGYEDNWETALVDAAALNILDDEPGEAFVRKNAFDMMHDAVYTKVSGSEMTLGQKLGKVPVEEEVVAEPVTIESVVALNSKVIEVALDEDLDAPEMVDASIFTVMDEDDAELAIESAKFAPWDADNYTVLVTLEESTTAGALYTVASGDTSAEFGGRAADETNPTVTSVTSSDYNEVTVVFSEAVNIDGLTLEVSEKYGSKDELAILDWAYDGNDTVVFTTEAQADATLYATVVEGAVDLAGNVMEKDEAKTFVGQEMDTSDVTVIDAAAEDFDQVVVNFSQKVDTVNPTMFAIAEKYGTKDEIVVLDAMVITDASDYTNATTDNKAVLLTVQDLTDATLYELTVTDLVSVYGNELNTDADTATFVGKEKPDADLTMTASAPNNTEVKVVFSQKVDADTVTLDAFTIAEKYGAKEELAITAFEIDKTDVVLTTSAQSDATLYEVTVTDVKDIYGNGLDGNEAIGSFVGKGIADEIKAIENIADTTGTDYKITLDFDQNYGTGGLNVSSYFIDNGIGYPSKVEAGSTDDEVVLTLSEKTTTGKLYEITVKNVKNADGVAMDSDGITKKFVGTGGATVSEPRLEAAVAANDQLVKLYFDTNVEDITGMPTGTSPASIVFTGTTVDPNGNAAAYAVIDENNPQILLVYTSTTDGFENGSGDTFTVDLSAITALDAEYDTVTAAENTAAPSKIDIEGVVATDSKTLKVYFNQPVRHIAPEATIDDDVLDQTFGYIDLDGSGAFTNAGDSEIIAAVALNDDYTQWELGLDVALGTSEYDLVVDTSVGASAISTLTNTMTTVGFDTTNATESFAFAGTDNFTAYIDDVYAVAQDARTVKLYFPEAMDSSTVEAATYTYKTTTGGAILLDVSYDSDNKTATLIFDTNMTNSTDHVVIPNGVVTNAIGNKEVETDTSADLEVEVARNTKTPTKVGIESASNAAQVITVEFDQAFKSTNTLDQTTLTDLLTITLGDGTKTLDDAALNNAASVVTKDADGNVVADSSTNYITTIEITVDTTSNGGYDIVANEQATVELIATEVITGIKGQAADTDADALIFVAE